MLRTLWLALAASALCFSACGDDAPRICSPGATQQCFCSGNTTGAQSCTASGTGWEACNCGQVTTPPPGPDATTDGAGCTPTTAQFEKRCYLNAVFWYDDCGTKQDQVVQQCQEPEETCVETETDGMMNATCQVGCAPMHHKGCENNSVWWFDSCNNKGELVETCPAGSQCKDKGGNDVVCEEGANCTPHAYEKCNGPDVYWFDSCDNVESLAAQCGEQEFCLGKKCVKPSYVGNWHVSANPNYKEGFGTYQEAICTLKVEESTVCDNDGAACTTDEDCGGSGICATQLTATLTDPIGAVYTGTIEGKLMKLTGSYQSGGIQVDATINVYFEISEEIGGKLPPDRFTGTQLEIVDIGLGPMQAVWNITGKKQ